MGVVNNESRTEHDFAQSLVWVMAMGICLLSLFAG